MALSQGQMLENRYRIERMLARGGMGAIYQGFDTNLNIPVAIKENFFRTPQAIRQFQREAQILARVHHPNLPRVIHHFSYTGQQYLVMDYIEGQDLWEMVKQQGQPLDEGRALDYLIQVCDAVEYLHRQNPPIIHRDIKPQNIKITPGGQAMLVDFGIAKVAEGDAHTQTGAQGVTPGFSPPEQYSGEGTTPASDVYSLGATLYAVLTGKKPPHSVSRLVNQAKFKPPAELNQKLSKQVSQAVVHAMQPRIQDRPASAVAWQRELEAILGQPTELQEPGSETTLFGQKGAVGWLVGPGGINHRVRMGSLTLGRSSTCDIHVKDRRASRKHATVKFDGQRYTIFDEGSANGTFVNEQPVGGKGIPLKLGDRLRIGDTVLTLSATAGATGAAPVEHVDELAGTAFVPDEQLPLPARRPASGPMIPPRPVSAPVTPAAVPPKRGGLLWVWVGLGMLAIILLLAATAALLYFQQPAPIPSTPTTDLQAMIAAASTATAQAVAQEPTSDSVEATLEALAATATAQANNAASEIDTEATVAAAIAATEAVRPATGTPTPTATATLPPPTVTPTSPPTATPIPPTPTFTPRPTSAPVVAAPLGVFQDFETDSSWKRGDEPNGTFSRSSNQAYSGDFSGQLNYNFPTTGNDYVVFLQSRLLADRPNALSAWVYGDGIGHFLNVWIKDAAGQTWQMSFGQEKHTGWKEMTARLDPGLPWPSGHISGPDNGVIDYPISFQGLVLDDGSDDFRGQGTIYIDNLSSLELGAPAGPSATPAATAPSVSPPVSSGKYVLAVASQHHYETWGAPRTDDICEAYRNKDFNDKIHKKGFNLELSLTNNSSQKVADNWAPSFITAQGREVQVCYYGYDGSGPLPNSTTVMTFFTIVEPDDYVRVVRLEVGGETLQICLDPGGAQTPC